MSNKGTDQDEQGLEARGGSLIAEVRKLVQDFAEGTSIMEVEVPGEESAKALMLVTPKGVTVSSAKSLVDAFRTRPERRQGTANFEDLDSFIAHALRFKGPTSALFARTADFGPVGVIDPYLQSVLNYHEESPIESGKPSFGDHRGRYICALSPEWRAWSTSDQKEFRDREFAEFIEERITDIADPSAADADLTRLAALVKAKWGDAARLMEVASGLTVHVNEKVSRIAKTASGEFEAVWKQEHSGADGAPLVVPSLFLIRIPVFRYAEPVLIGVRLKYRVSEGQIFWRAQRYRPDLALEAAFEAVCAKAAAETGLPLFRGTPEYAA